MQCLVSLGSNIGASLTNIELAKVLISKKNKILKTSRLMKTSPIGELEQNFFLNQLILIATNLTPYDLLDFFKKIELELGRVKRPRWMEREIDIDIITYDNLVLNTDKLTIPHKELTNRLFILAGAKEIAPSTIVATYDKSFLSLYEIYKDVLKEQSLEYITQLT